MEGNQFNLVFSDALHTPEAILFEFEMLAKYGLLADKFNPGVPFLAYAPLLILSAVLLAWVARETIQK